MMTHRSWWVVAVALCIAARAALAVPEDDKQLLVLSDAIMQEAERQLLVGPGGPHRDRQWAAVHADLERLLDRDLIGAAVVLHASMHPWVHPRQYPPWAS